MMELDLRINEIAAAFHFIAFARVLVDNYDAEIIGENVIKLWPNLEEALSPATLAALKEQEPLILSLFEDSGMLPESVMKQTCPQNILIFPRDAEPRDPPPAG